MSTVREVTNILIDKIGAHVSAPRNCSLKTELLENGVIISAVYLDGSLSDPVKVVVEISTTRKREEIIVNVFGPEGRRIWYPPDNEDIPRLRKVAHWVSNQVRASYNIFDLKRQKIQLKIAKEELGEIPWALRAERIAYNNYVVSLSQVEVTLEQAKAITQLVSSWKK